MINLRKLTEAGRTIRLFVWSGVFFLIVVFCGAVLYGHGRSRIAAGIYQSRLRDVSRDYENLKNIYNQVVRRTAVTELRVTDSKVDVIIRTADGRNRVISTPFSAADEIYVDYVVMDNRLLIRRLFTSEVPAREGVVVTADLVDVDWSETGMLHGTAIYRTLSDGRWGISVSGDGALTLAKVEDSAALELEFAPQIKDYSTLTANARQNADRISFIDVLAFYTRKFRPGS